MNDSMVIAHLAHKAARKGLKFRDAVALFEALYICDAIVMAGGNKTRAAEAAGVDRPYLSRWSRGRLHDREDVGG